MDQCPAWYDGSVWHKDWPHKIYVSQRPIFHGPVILPYILKTIWWMKVTLDIMDQCDAKIDHIKYIYRSLTYISWCSDFALYLENYLMDEGHTSDNGSVWHKDWPHKICVGQWPIFGGPVILLHIFISAWWRNIIFGIMDQCDTKDALIKQMWGSNLYFMVQWFCFITWRLFDGWRSYLI